jgi:hypothetical protein
MSEHVFDDLPQLLSGEADRRVVTAAAAHLRSCDDCRDELISALVAHAALMSAVRFAPDLATSPEPIESPIKAVHGGVPLPDLSAVFAQVRAETGTEDAPAKGRLRPIARYRWLAAAAVVLVGVAAGGILAAERSGSSQAPERSIALRAYDEGTSNATAKLVGSDQMRLDASSLPALANGRYYEVWLTNHARTAMAPVGQLNTSGMGTFTVPSSEMANYGAIEVSVQSTAGVGNYSGVSVLRGIYG